MRKINFTAHVLPHFVAVVVFLVITVFFFNPIFFESKALQQGDILQFLGSAKSIMDYRAQTGDEALWSDSMFGGMPAYLISVQWGNQALGYLKTVMGVFLPHPIANIFLAFVCYYILLLSFRIRPYLAIAGAIAFGLSTYMIIGLAAGHNSRIGAIAFMPLVMAGIHLAFTNRRMLGFGVTTAGMALHLRENHVQITYYLLLIVLVYGLVRLVEAVRAGTLPGLLRKIGVLVVAVVIAVGTFFGPFWALREYSAYSTRGKSELLTDTPGIDGAGGMSKAYAFDYSNGILEPMTLMIPNFYGGASSNFLVADRDSEVYQALMRSGDQETANQLARFTGAYWGEQRIAAPYYAGAITVFLFALGIAFARKQDVWWLLPLSILSIVLSWGSNFAAFNYFMFDYFPGYNNFRSVTFALVIVLFSMPLLGLLGLENLLSSPSTKDTRKKLLIAFAFTGGLALVLWLFAGMFSFIRDIEAQLPGWFTDALADDRRQLFRGDAFRSFIFIALAFGAVYFQVFKRVSMLGLCAALAFLMTVDLATANKRYFTENNYKRKRDNSYFAMTPADQEILKDKSHYRVYNLSYLTGSGDSPFAEARTSYHHNSIGGYHGAKLRRYAEFYDSCVVVQTQQFVDRAQQGEFSFTGLGALNMLNIKYAVVGQQADAVLRNESAHGNAWFVSDVKSVNSPLEELEETCSADTRKVAIIDKTKFQVDMFDGDSSGTITLTEHTPRYLRYESQSAKDGLAIFSEIYYPGWEATIDGQKVDVIRANYILRALTVPAGSHTIEFTFRPKPYIVGNKVTAASSWVVLIILLGSLGLSLRKEQA